MVWDRIVWGRIIWNRIIPKYIWNFLRYFNVSTEKITHLLMRSTYYLMSVSLQLFIYHKAIRCRKLPWWKFLFIIAVFVAKISNPLRRFSCLFREMVRPIWTSEWKKIKPILSIMQIDLQSLWWYNSTDWHGFYFSYLWKI